MRKEQGKKHRQSISLPHKCEQLAVPFSKVQYQRGLLYWELNQWTLFLRTKTDFEKG